MLRNFDTAPICDGNWKDKQTDRQMHGNTQGHSTYRANT